MTALSYSEPNVLLESEGGGTGQYIAWIRWWTGFQGCRIGACQMNEYEVALRVRIAALVESVQDDQSGSQGLFQYVWAMMCVRRGLLRIVRELSVDGVSEIILEEVRTGRQRRVTRPRGMDSDLETLAVEALAKILSEVRLAG